LGVVPAGLLIDAIATEGYRPEYLIPLLFGVAVVGFLLAPTLWVVQSSLRRGTRFATLRIDRDLLSLEAGDWLGSARHEVAIDAIEAVDLTATPAAPGVPFVVVRTDDLELVLTRQGELDPDGLEWLRAAVFELASR